MKRALAAGLCALFLCSHIRAEDAAAPAYIWKPGDVYRFDFSKSITMAPKLGEPADQRKTDVAGILIFEVASNGKSATMRFDSPRVTLPEVVIYSSQADDPEVQKDKNRVIAKAIESALKAARWDVELCSDGTLRIRDRKPNNFIEWAKEVENAGGWRRKSYKNMQQLIDNDLGLKVQVDDQELFLCMAQPKPAAESEKAEAALRPVRTRPVAAGVDGDKAKFKFTRQAPPDEGKPFIIPDLTTTGQVTATLSKIQNAEGTATMDTRLSMLDTLTEDFTSEISIAYEKQTIQRQVRVQYRLKRLAPPIVKQ